MATRAHGGAGCTPDYKPRVPHLGKHIRRNVVGAICPQSGEFFSLIFDGVDSAVSHCWLDELAQCVPPKSGVRRLAAQDQKPPVASL